MDYANLAGLAIAGTGGLILGTVFGQKLAADGISVLKAIETRLASIESIFSSGAQGSASMAHAATVEKYNGAIEKLAAAIEKHAAAIDDHGAATVAAAVETHAAMHPTVYTAAAKSA
jgi:uncharacterized protein YukE